MFEVWRSQRNDYFLCKTKIYVPDKPGSLSKLAGYFAQCGINITYFYYNRSEHPNLVLIEGKHTEEDALNNLYNMLNKERFFDEIYEEDLEITNLNNILKISVYLEHKPGSLHKFAQFAKRTPG